MRRYYKDRHHTALAALRLGDYAPLAAVGIDVLQGMHDKYHGKGGKIVQICGPMSTGGFGDLDTNMRVFQACVSMLDREQYGSEDRPNLVVFDQMPLQDGIITVSNYRPGAPYDTRILTDIYGPLFGAGFVKTGLFLPNWASSEGATWEREHLADRGIVIEEYPEDTFGRVLAELGL